MRSLADRTIEDGLVAALMKYVKHSPDGNCTFTDSDAVRAAEDFDGTCRGESAVLLARHLAGLAKWNRAVASGISESEAWILYPREMTLQEVLDRRPPTTAPAENKIAVAEIAEYEAGLFTASISHCPFCGVHHSHGRGITPGEVILGWRLPHCKGGKPAGVYYVCLDHEILGANEIVRMSNGAFAPTKEGARMRPYVRLFKDGDHMAIETNCTEEREFLEHFSIGIEALINEHRFDGDWEFQLRHWIPQGFEVLAKLRGYKSDVTETRVLLSGTIPASSASLVHDTSSAPNADPVVVEEQE